MEKINMEILVSSLFVVGFDQVDSLLFTYTLGKLSIENRELNLFEYKEDMLSDIFNKYVIFDGVTYKLKDGYTLDTNIPITKNHKYPLKKALLTNKTLISYLNDFDFNDIVARKISKIGEEKIQDNQYLFSSKEKEIINEININKPKIKSIK